MSVLADWLARQAGAALLRSDLLPEQRRALHAIQRCRTPALGGHRYRCTHCGEEHLGFHSCHHRACPRCGGAKTEEWTRKQVDRLLPVPYFFVTCTVPETLHGAFAARPDLVHDIFFKTAAGALQTIAAIPRHLGAEIGMLGVLHTCGRQVQRHPHLHFIVPGGGLRADHRKWRKTRRPDYLLPNEPIAAELRRRFAEALLAAAPELHAQIPESAWFNGWWVHIEAAGTGENVVKYLARYVQHTAISDERILGATDDHVRFSYTDSRTQEHRQCELTRDEFLRRYLQHILPAGQHRVRYFGWLHPSAKRRRMLVDGAQQRGDGRAQRRPEATPRARAAALAKPAREGDRRAREGGAAAALAPALSPLRAVYPGRRRQAAAHPRTAMSASSPNPQSMIASLPRTEPKPLLCALVPNLWRRPPIAGSDAALFTDYCPLDTGYPAQSAPDRPRNPPQRRRPVDNAKNTKRITAALAVLLR